MHQKIIPLLFLVLFFLNAAAQDTADKTALIQLDSILPVLKTQDGKIVTVGKPVSTRPLSTMDKITLFFEAAYAKYPVWCWIWAVIAILAIGRFLIRLFSK